MIHDRHAPDLGSAAGPEMGLCLDLRLCQRSSVVVGMIPNVKAGLALRAFNCLVSGVRLGRYQGPLEVSLAEVDGATAVLGPHRPDVITPRARLLRRMVEAGLISQRRASSSRDLSVLDAYIAAEPELLR